MAASSSDRNDILRTAKNLTGAERRGVAYIILSSSGQSECRQRALVAGGAGDLRPAGGHVPRGRAQGRAAAARARAEAQGHRRHVPQPPERGSAAARAPAREPERVGGEGAGGQGAQRAAAQASAGAGRHQARHDRAAGPVPPQRTISSSPYIFIILLVLFYCLLAMTKLQCGQHQSYGVARRAAGQVRGGEAGVAAVQRRASERHSRGKMGPVSGWAMQEQNGALRVGHGDSMGF
ncbi:hypothetical protein ON010_g4523 [Phytophthora cinnamomi]|nr:hypothetical protein ON010_g4523 [Phytophthora cinnamomi]